MRLNSTRREGEFFAIQLVVFFALFSAAAFTHGEANLIKNPGFEDGLAYWETRPGEPLSAALATELGVAHSGRACLRLRGVGRNSGIQTVPLYPGLDLDLERKYILSLFLKNNGVREGEFGIRLYFCDAKGRCLVMKSFATVARETPLAGWERYAFRFGPGEGFQIPPDTDHVFVRASFYRKDGDCDGEVMLDDFALVSEDVVETGTNLPPKDVVAIWRYEKSTTAPPTEPLRRCLEQGGYTVRVVTANDLTDPDRFTPALYDLLVVVDGSVYPAGGKMPLLRFLRGGGNVLILGRPGLQEMLYPTSEGWLKEADLATQPVAESPVRPAAEHDTSVWKTNLGPKDSKPSLEFVTERGAQALSVRAEVVAYQYVTLEVSPPADPSYCILHFSARGDPQTPYLAVELNEKDKSRWKAVVPLSETWKEYDLHVGRFHPYASEKRGQPTDYFHVENAASVAFGFPKSLVGEGRHSFALRHIVWRKSRLPQNVPVGDALYFGKDPLEAFGSQLKRRSRFFLGIAADVHSRNEIWADSGIACATNALAPGPETITVETHRRVRLLRPDGDEEAFILGQINKDSLFENSAVLFCAPPEVDEAGLPKRVAQLARYVVEAPIITGIELAPAVKDGTVLMGLDIRLSNRSRSPQQARLLAEVEPSERGRTALKEEQRVELPARRQTIQRAETWPLSAFDWRSFRFKANVGLGADAIEDTFDVRTTLAGICEYAVAEQKRRGDGKFSGYTYRDSRVARTLLAGYDLFGRKDFLDSAIVWGDTVIAEQREDGGYRMGYGITRMGEECFVADGGEIGLGIARLYTYVPEGKKAAYLRSLERYSGFRESFRCEGGGLGIGYAAANYGVDPRKRFDRVEKVFDPEHNHYTIGCTLGFASAYAALTDKASAHEAAARDARWLMTRQPNRTHGVFAEGFIWAHRFVRDEALRVEIASYLQRALIQPALNSSARWWVGGGGRSVLALSALSYFENSIRHDPLLQAHILKVTYRLCAPSSDESVRVLLNMSHILPNDWHYLGYGGVSLAEVLSPGCTLKPLRQR